MVQSIFVIILTLYCLFSYGQKYQQIIAKEQIVVDTFFNKYISEDRYRWLENVNSLDTKEWLEQQNKLYKNYVSKAVDKSESYYLIDKYSYVISNNPVKEGNYYFSIATYDEGVPALFYQSKIEEEAEILVDPNLISNKDKIVIKNFSVSKDSKLLAYKFTRNGSDWNEVNVVSLNTANQTKDHLTGLKFSNVSWRGNGFYYSTFSQDSKFGKTKNQKIFYHKIGNEQKSDSIIYEVSNGSLDDFLTFQTTSDERFFIIKSRNEKTNISNFYYIDFNSDSRVIKPLITKVSGINILDSQNDKLIAVTSKGANFGRIIEIDPEKPIEQRTIVKERVDTLLLKVIPFADRIVAVYQSNQRPIVMIIDYKGNVLHKLRFPIASSVSGFTGNYSDVEFLFSFNSYTIPPIVYKFNIKTFKKELAKRTKINFSIDDVEYKEVEYLSNDSVKIPMILAYKKGLILDGKNPTILNAYGGFGVVETPDFDAGIVYFIKQGGVYAFANIRGGGEKGSKWANQGSGAKKQKSFDDFIAAAEYLIKNKYTSNNKLAATGGSNGGLVVAAAAIQRPDLFKAVVPLVAPLDMIRFDKFTVGHWMYDEYGNVNDSISFKRIFNYSPFHNIKEDINYPAMLVLTSENDDRVPPFHSYKFVAKLQSRVAQKNPIILKVEKEAGHNGGPTLLKRLQTKSEVYGFIMNELTK